MRELTDEVSNRPGNSPSHVSTPNDRPTPDEVARALRGDSNLTITWRRSPRDAYCVEWLLGDEVIACDRADAFVAREKR